jgi:exodeoxyribonuclease VII large subunit
VRAASTESDALIGAVGASARLLVRESAVHAEALMREIAGQGPEKTLSRGFAVVRNRDGKTLTRAAQVSDGGEIQIQFHDGRVAAIAEEHL